MLPPDRTLQSRHECKYFVPEDRVPALRALVRPFMRPDRFAARSPGYRYMLSSLYLDSPELDLLRSTEEGHKNRFKLRIRSYGDDPAQPVFLEIKRRVDGIVRKARAGLERDHLASILGGAGNGARFGALPPDAAEFVHLVRELGARPTMHVRYVREAYEAIGGAPVRVTLDRELARAVGRDWQPRLAGDDYRSTPLQGVILEVKFTDSSPPWVHDIVSRLELQRRSIPKYVLCLHAALARGEIPGRGSLAREATTRRHGRG